MPWEKSFDIEEATRKATEVFTRKGFEATSLSDLIQAMQINKGSLYNAFGSKKDLFCRALARYDQHVRAARLEELRARPDSRAAIAALFDGFIEEARKDPRNLGCFVVNTAQDLPNLPPDVADMVREALKDIERFFEEMIRRGQAQGQIEKSLDASRTAQALLALLVGLRLLARGGAGIPALEASRDGAMRLLEA
jgi:TetR/AcrR family transcriptional repressor of nem operon